MATNRNNQPAGSGPDGTIERSGYVGSVHLSVANLISYGVLSAAGMLAFFFAFQATILGAVIGQLPAEGTIQRVIFVVVSIFMLGMTSWSYVMVRLVTQYLAACLERGSTFENALELKPRIYDALFSVYHKDNSGLLLFLTRTVLIILCGVWVLIGIWAAVA